MELYKEILANYLTRNWVGTDLPVLSIEDIVEIESYVALHTIKTVIEDDSLKDSECYKKIEAIIREFEAIGSSGGKRHN